MSEENFRVCLLLPTNFWLGFMWCRITDPDHYYFIICITCKSLPEQILPQLFLTFTFAFATLFTTMTWFYGFNLLNCSPQPFHKLTSPFSGLWFLSRLTGIDLHTFLELVRGWSIFRDLAHPSKIFCCLKSKNHLTAYQSSWISNHFLQKKVWLHFFFWSLQLRKKNLSKGCLLLLKYDIHQIYATVQRLIRLDKGKPTIQI